MIFLSNKITVIILSILSLSLYKLSMIIEVLLIAFTIFFEASGEIRESKIGHGWVIKNRVEHTLFSKNYISVIFQKKQFSCYNDNEILKHILRLEADSFYECFSLADSIYYNLIPDNTNGSLWYVKHRLRRIWMKDLQFNVQLGTTDFYGLKNINKKEKGKK